MKTNEDIHSCGRKIELLCDFVSVDAAVNFIGG